MRFTIVLLAVLFPITAHAYAYVVQFNDGQIHNYDQSWPFDSVAWVDFQSPTVRTTLNWLPGARVDSIEVYNDGILNIAGGEINGPHDQACGCVAARDTSSIVMTSGNLQSSDLFAFDQASVSILGGFVDRAFANGNGSVEISGGYLFSYITAIQNGRVLITGGLLGLAGVVQARDFGVITFHGTNFELDGLPVPFGSLDLVPDTASRRLTGLLADGSSFDKLVNVTGSGSIVLAPEPSTALLVGLGLTLIGVVRNRRTR